MAITEMYHTCFGKIRQLRPQERVTRVRNMAWLLAGLFVGQCVHLSHIARKLPGVSQKLSKVKMLSRLLDNRHIRVRLWYEPVARGLLTTAVQHGQTVRLLVDGTKVGNGHQLLMVALAYRRRALPIAWTWVKGKRGHSSAQKQCALLAENLDLQQTTMQQGQVEAHVEADAAFHILLAEFLGNQEILRVMEHQREKLAQVALRLSRQYPDRMAKSQAEHRAIFAAICAGDGDLAALLLREHLERGKHALLGEA